MADEILTGQREMTELPHDDDLIHIVDVSDSTDNPAGSSYKWKIMHYLKTIFPSLEKTSVESSANPTPTGDKKENEYYLTALAEDATFGEPSGTPVNGNTLFIRIKDDATARTLDWNAIYEGGYGITLPTTTTISKTMYLGFIYNSAESKWALLSLIEQE